MERLRALKGVATVAAIVPTRAVADTIGGVVQPLVGLSSAGVLDEVIVVDAGSADATATVAAAAGAKVLQQDRLMTEYGPALGKGDAMWRALSATRCDVVVFVDGDTREFGDHFVRGLIGPLLENPRLQLVKGAYRRPFCAGSERIADGGGRVSELTARPLLNLWFPELAALQQPLAGELAARRTTLAGIPFAVGYGVEIQMLIDVYRAHGIDAIAQCDIGQRINEHQSLARLSAMAFTILRAVAARVALPVAEDGRFLRYAEGRLEEGVDTGAERPPLTTVECNERTVVSG